MKILILMMNFLSLITKSDLIYLAFSGDRSSVEAQYEKAKIEYFNALSNLSQPSPADVEKLRKQILVPAQTQYDRSNFEYSENERRRIQSEAQVQSQEAAQRSRSESVKVPKESDLSKLSEKMEQDRKAGKIKTEGLEKSKEGSSTDKIVKEKSEAERKKGKSLKDIQSERKSKSESSQLQESIPTETSSVKSGSSGQPKATGLEREKYELDGNGISKEIEFSGKKALLKNNPRTAQPSTPSSTPQETPGVKGDGQTMEIEFPGKAKSGKK